VFDVDKIAERRIVDAMEHGEFDNLPGAGRPLDLNDVAGVPESLRMAYRVLKNAGVLPPEIDLRREIAAVHDAISAMTDGEPRSSGIKRLNLLRATLAAHRGDEMSLIFEKEYLPKAARKLEKESS